MDYDELSLEDTIALGATTGRGPLVDGDLTPELRSLAKAVTLSLTENRFDRAKAVFLGTAEYDELEYAPDVVIGKLMLLALPGFLREIGGRVALGLNINEKHVSPVGATSVKVDGETRRCLSFGTLFVDLPHGRTVLRVDSPFQNPAGRYLIGLATSGRQAIGFYDDWERYARGNNHLRSRAFYADGTLLDVARRYRWEDIQLPPSVRQTIRLHVEGFLRHRNRLRELGVKRRRGLILAGPPGTGKTLLGKVLAGELGISFVWVHPRHITKDGSLAGIMELAQFVAPAVMFLEDIDLYGGDREEGHSSLLGELMNMLDGCQDREDILAIATTNRPELVEAALRNRPGRFDRIVRIDAMGAECRMALLRRHLAKARIAAADMEILGQRTADYTGAQIEELASTLLLLAVQREPEGDGPAPVIDRTIIDAALADMLVERKTPVGFHAA